MVDEIVNIRVAGLDAAPGDTLAVRLNPPFAARGA
jgi:hypothetical protein